MKRLAARFAVVACVTSLVASSVFAGNYRNFTVAIYIPVGVTRQLANPQTLQQQFDRISSQVKFDKVYLETYRSRQFADDATIEPIKKFFQDKGIQVSGGITLVYNDSGQFETFSYANPDHRAEVQRAVEMVAKHYDEVILDDFFFYSTKTDADIAAKGNKSWTQYRLDAMRDAAENLVIKPARAVNPKIKLVIKYPNWYEHFQASGYDLEQEAKMFDGIYTGTETRDPFITDQLLQQYESYLIFRYFDNIKPNGGNGGGWVDTFSTQYIDRYAEQLWNTMFAKAPEITLFNWSALASQPARAGDRAAWQEKQTSFNYDAMVKSYTPGNPTWARAAGYSLEQVDTFLGKLGKPIGLASYKPYQSSGEDFLHNYLGMLGIPIELYPTFPTDASIVLLTESAKSDPQIVEKMKSHLAAGRNVVITSGLLRALQGKGIEDIVELGYTDHKIAIKDFLNGYGAGNGTSLNGDSQNPPTLFPEIRFFTNDSWTLIRGVANAKGFPILLMDKYSKGILYVLTIPDNVADLYNLPRGVINVVKNYLLRDFPIRVDAPPQVAVFAYDNNTFIVESYAPTEVDATVAVAGEFTKLRNLVTGQVIESQAPARAGRGRGSGGLGAAQGPARTNFPIQLPPHSYQVFAAEK